MGKSYRPSGRNKQMDREMGSIDQWMGGQKGSWADRETNRFTSKHINLNNRYVKNKNYSCIDGHGHEHH